MRLPHFGQNTYCELSKVSPHHGQYVFWDDVLNPPSLSNGYLFLISSLLSVISYSEKRLLPTALLRCQITRNIPASMNIMPNKPPPEGMELKKNMPNMTINAATIKLIAEISLPGVMRFINSVSILRLILLWI